MIRRILLAAAVAACAAGCTGNAEQKAPNPFPSGPTATTLKDALIFAAVKAQLTAIDPDSSTTLGVGVREGVVTLRGSTRDAKARVNDVAAARKITGVQEVVDQLRVDPRGPRPGQQLSDAALATRVTTAFTAQLGLQRVAVHVDHGAVTLEGTVKDAKTKDAIVQTARATSGVRSVVDQLAVGAP
ncbi:MAG: BON domain-containing protein [Candidatus Elarobacter sp.]